MDTNKLMITKRKRPRVLTDRMKGFVRDFVLTENATQAAHKNYNATTDDSAGVIGAYNLANPRIIKAIEVERAKLADQIPDELVVRMHKELLNKREIGKTLKNGKVVLSDQPETQAVSRGVELAYKLKGSLAPEEHKNINVNLSLSDLIKRAKESLEKKDV